MINVREVKTKKDAKQFADFANNLYKGNDCYVPPLYSDEIKVLTKNPAYKDTCEWVYYLAERDGKIVGRIGAILQKVSNKIRDEKRVRFTRFDAINDQEVANALFSAVENWAKSKGMDTICGPLGFSDLEREGLLVEGFDIMNTAETQYNYEYYKELIENCGYQKEVDWIETRLYKPDVYDERFVKLAYSILEKNGLHIPKEKTIGKFIDKYVDKFFEIVDDTYKDLYQSVPFDENMKKDILSLFRLTLDLEKLIVIVDKNDRVVAFAICFPSLSKALKKCKGHLTPLGIARLLWAIKHPKVIDFGLIGVRDEYLSRGVASVIVSLAYRKLFDGNIEYIETNPNLETNVRIRNQWKRFKQVPVRRRRSFIKKIDKTDNKTNN